MTTSSTPTAPAPSEDPIREVIEDCAALLMETGFWTSELLSAAADGDRFGSATEYFRSMAAVMAAHEARASL